MGTLTNKIAQKYAFVQNNRHLFFDNYLYISVLIPFFV